MKLQTVETVTITQAKDTIAQAARIYFARDRQGRSDFRGGNRTFNAPHTREPRAAAPQPAGPADFEARLKQFMQASDSRLSDLKLNEKRSSRRGHR